MRKVFTGIKVLATGAIFIVFAAILAVTVKGVPGNPEPKDIKTFLSNKSLPFELSPERGRYAIVQSLIDNNSFYFSNEIAEYVAPDIGYNNGKFVSLFAPGVSILSIPFYVYGKSIGYAQVSTYMFTALVALLNMVVLFFIVKRYTNSSISALIASMSYAFSTNAWAYSTTLYQHHLTALLLLLSLWLLSKPLNILTPFLIAFFAGIGFFVEYPNILFFVPMIVVLLTKAIEIKEFKERVSISVKWSLLGAVIGIALALIPSFWFNLNSYGNATQIASTVQGSDEFSVDWTTGDVRDEKQIGYTKSAISFFSLERLPNSMTVLLASPDRGLLIYAPVMILGLWGLVILYKKDITLSLLYLSEIIAIFSLYGMWGDPWGGWAFGPRYLVPVYALLSVLVGVALHKYKRKIIFIATFIPLFVYGVVVNAFGAFTTNQLPPSVESDSALFPKYLFLHSFELIRNGVSGSFIFNFYLSKYITLDTLVFIVIGTIIGMLVIFYTLLLVQKEKHEL